MRPFVGGLLAAALASACGSSPPVEFYVLDPVHPVRAASARADLPPIQVAVVHIPAMLDRQEMARESTAAQLDVSDRHRWAAPLDEMTVRVLTQDLAERLPAGMVIFPKSPPPGRVDDIVVDILQFTSDPAGAVTFDGSWTLVPSGSDSVLVSRQLHLTQHPQGRSYRDQASAMSDILGALADSVVAGLPERR